MILKYLIRKLAENNEDTKVHIKVVSGYRELEGEIMEIKIKVLEYGKILVTMNIGKDN